MAGIPVARARHAAFHCPVGSVTAKQTATHATVFRFTDTLLVSGAVLIGNTERLPDRTLILPVLHEMGTVSMNRAMNTIHTAARVGT